MKLCELEVGNKAVIKKISLCGTIRRRLFDIGLIEGTKIMCVMQSPSGDPIAYRIRGSVIALRQKDSKFIEIAKI